MKEKNVDSDLEGVKWIKSPNCRNRRLPNVSLLVIHWTGGTFRSAVNWFKIKEWKDKTGEIKRNYASSHYVIDVDGDIVQMVKENQTAYHAGKSKLNGHKLSGNSLNDCSLGIELAGPPSSVNETKWKASQISACVKLCKDISKRFPGIKITDHSTISPKRKVDVKMGTGVNEFPWDSFVKKTGLEEA